MKLGIMQPYFFPYLGYFQLIHAVDRYLLHDGVDFSNCGWTNHNRILVVGREPIPFSIPVRQRRRTQRIREVELAGGRRARRKLLRTLEVNYGRSAHFREIFPLVEDILLLETDFLAELNRYGIVEVCRFLGIETEILTDCGPFEDLEEELRRDGVDLAASFPQLRLDPPETKVVRVLELCRRLGAEVFINAIGGRALYDKTLFARNGIDLYFVQTRPYEYRQRATSFYPDLSILDVLMNCGRETTRRLVEQYDLI